MQFPTRLIQATLVRRYKRFLADCILPDGSEITASVPNTGSMRGLTAEGSDIWLSTSDNPKRKYRHTLEIVYADGGMVGINTGLPNKITEEAIRAGLIDDLAAYPILKREQRYGENSRIDILLETTGDARAYVEVKNVHFMREQGLAEFPDSKTARGVKHLDELANMAQQGYRAIMVYIIQRGDCHRLSFCRDIDPAYGEAFDRAAAKGVEAFAIRCDITAECITPVECVPIEH